MEVGSQLHATANFHFKEIKTLVPIEYGPTAMLMILTFWRTEKSAWS
jgi:hypothetical protein